MKVISPLIVGNQPTRGVSETISSTTEDIEAMKKKLEEIRAKAGEKKASPNRHSRAGEKNTRQAKPIKSPFTERLLAALYVLNCNKWAGENSKFLRDASKIPGWEVVDGFSNDDIRFLRGDLSKIYDLIQVIVNQGPEIEIREWLEWAEKLMKSATTTVEYRNGRLSINPDRIHAYDPVEILITRLIIAVFHSLSREGPLYVGACPRCGTLFEKKRGDQEYCSKTCATYVRQERFQKK